jgi:hypothetical protein
MIGEEPPDEVVHFPLVPVGGLPRRIGLNGAKTMSTITANDGMRIDYKGWGMSPTLSSPAEMQ